ncbi:MAG: hypothetical protein AB8H03_25900 [Saprospiraceae bacterium]
MELGFSMLIVPIVTRVSSSRDHRKFKGDFTSPITCKTMKHIESNKLYNAFEEIRPLINYIKIDELGNSFTLLINRFNRLEGMKIKGIISHDNSNLEENQIVNSFIKLVNQINEIEFKLQVIK